LVVEDGVYDRATVWGNDQALWSNTSDGGTLEHVDREWRFHDLELEKPTPLFGMPVTMSVSWEIASDSSRELGGWNLDDVCLVATGKTSAECGNGRIEDGEQCDDRNPDDGDGCSSACAREVDLDVGCCSTG